MCKIAKANSNFVAYPYNESLLWFVWLGPAVPKMIYD